MDATPVAISPVAATLAVEERSAGASPTLPLEVPRTAEQVRAQVQEHLSSAAAGSSFPPSLAPGVVSRNPLFLTDRAAKRAAVLAAARAAEQAALAAFDVRVN